MHTWTNLKQSSVIKYK